MAKMERSSYISFVLMTHLLSIYLFRESECVYDNGAVLSVSGNKHEIGEASQMREITYWSEGKIKVQRKKRHAIQLAVLIQEHTNYTAGKLLYYGNYCGFGSDRAGDGSTVDGCDDCCKAHDTCYDEIMFHNTTKKRNVSTTTTTTTTTTPPSAFDISKINETSVHENNTYVCIPYKEMYKMVKSPEGIHYCVHSDNITTTIPTANVPDKTSDPLFVSTKNLTRKVCLYMICNCDLQLIQCLKKLPC